MANDGQKNCGYSGYMLGYLYREIDEAGRRRFEDHLAHCDACVDEFAEMSDARFSVLEWQLAEFAELPTPRIVIPYETATKSSTSGWLAGWTDVTSLSTWVPAAAAALLIAVVGIGSWILNNSMSSGSVPLVAAVSEPVSPTGPAPSIERSLDAVPAAGVSSEPDLRGNALSRRPSASVPVRSAPKPAPTRSLTANVPKLGVNTSDQAVQKKPVLSTFEDDEDKSLRLSDLFDDGGA